MISLILIGILLSVLPFVELRIAIPFLISAGIDPLLTFLVCTAANIAIIPFIFIFLDYAHLGLMRFAFYRKTFAFTLKRLRKREQRVKKSIERYGLLGLALFVALPIPVTGAYTGALIAWLLGIKKEKAAAYIVAGVLIAGILVTLASVGILNILKIL